MFVVEVGDGEIVVLENFCFNKGEKKGDVKFVSELVVFGDIYCNDVFGICYCKDVFMVVVLELMFGKLWVVGFLVVKEI